METDDIFQRAMKLLVWTGCAGLNSTQSIRLFLFFMRTDYKNETFKSSFTIYRHSFIYTTTLSTAGLKQQTKQQRPALTSIVWSQNQTFLNFFMCSTEERIM